MAVSVTATSVDIWSVLMTVSPLCAAAYGAATSVLWKAVTRCSWPSRISTAVASALCVPASGPPGT